MSVGHALAIGGAVILIEVVVMVIVIVFAVLMGARADREDDR